MDGGSRSLYNPLPVPEGPEVDTDKLREQIAEDVEHGGALLKRIALTTALLAVFATLAGLKAGGTINEALMLRTEGTRLEAAALDQWAFYQAKGVRAAVEDAARAAWLAEGKEPPSEYTEKMERQLAEQKEIEAEGAGEGAGTRRKADRIRSPAPRASLLRGCRGDLSGCHRARGGRGLDEEPARLARLACARRRRSRAPRGHPVAVSRCDSCRQELRRRRSGTDDETARVPGDAGPG